ncbi:aminoglycoside phosphotransferase family protein [Knoellia sp. LjRoot47]|uniref:aminoglycoside phosphotransferase family protein n=1 Tax=Knoellia sp. LjRoot47 TaxID=3342330 RepID=UPI003ECDD7F1
MDSTPSLLGSAVRHGLVPVSDVRAGRVHVRPVSRSNHVHVVERAGVAVGYVKQPGTAASLDGDDTVSVEASILGAIAPLRLAPTPIRQGGSGPVWMTPLPGVELRGVGGDAVLRPVATDLGRALARLHRHAVAGARLPRATTPWPLLDALPPSMSGGRLRDDTRSVLARLDTLAIRRAVDRARAQWRPTHLVHGDIAAGNVIVETTPAGGVRVGLIDFELGGLGSPEHDLASAAAMLTSLSRPGLDLAALCLDAYWTACGPGTLTGPWRCVRALMTAWQVALNHGESGAADVARLLSLAEAAAEEGPA